MTIRTFVFQMHYLYISCLILLCELTIEGSHFRGGTITWKPINNSDTGSATVSIMITQTYLWTHSVISCTNSMITNQSPTINLGSKSGNGKYLMCNDSCSTSGGYVGNEVPITGYCTDFSTKLDTTVSQRSDTVSLTAGANFNAAFGTGGGWVNLALGSSSGWSLSTFIDIRTRSDNGLINTAPVAAYISYVSIPAGVQKTIQIPVLDADNDYTQCRFASGSTECVNTCPPGSLPGGTTLTVSCILTITGTSAGDYYLVALQVNCFDIDLFTISLTFIFSYRSKILSRIRALHH